jgi:hypothetical protein
MAGTRAMQCRCDADALLSLALPAKVARSSALEKYFSTFSLFYLAPLYFPVFVREPVKADNSDTIAVFVKPFYA